MKFILGKKIEMSQIFDEKGDVIPVTLVEAGPCFITQIKTKDKDGYDSVQIGFEKLKKKKITKSKRKKPYKYIREFRIEGSTFLPAEALAKAGAKASSSALRATEDKSAGKDRIDVSFFEKGDRVKISGISKGKGFAGVIKRHGFKSKPASHGVKHEERSMGSVGSSFPERVVKGKKMPGRMGTERITVKNLKIVKIDKENNLIAVKGAVPGRRGTLLEIRG